jgi:hypothetical protein
MKYQLLLKANKLTVKKEKIVTFQFLFIKVVEIEIIAYIV